VIDADIQSPRIHVLFGLAGADVQASLNDFLFGEREIGEVAVDVERRGRRWRAGLPDPVAHAARRAHALLREGYDPHRLTTGLREPVDGLALDVLLIDTHPELTAGVGRRMD
jgi:MinD-like ATPase involved in chromosome partitioning or flagellar assembly